MKLVLTVSAAALMVGLAATACEESAAPVASKGDRSGIVMGQRGDDELMVGPVDGKRAFIRKATAEQIEACTRKRNLAYPGCLP